MPSSVGFVSALIAQESADAILLLVRIEHADLPEPLKFAANWEDVTSNLETYAAYPFAFQPPAVGEEGRASASIQIDNVDRRILEAIEPLEGEATLDLYAVLASAPDDVEVAWQGFRLTGVDADRLTITGALEPPSLGNEPANPITFAKKWFPGLY